jgi:heat shock protein 1/8
LLLQVGDADRTKILAKCDETIKWLEANQAAEKEEFEHHLKELESVCNPIITKMYQGAGGAPPPGGMPGQGQGGHQGGGGGGKGPTIEEVD